LPNDFDNSSGGKLMGLATKSEAYAAEKSTIKKRKTTLEHQTQSMPILDNTKPTLKRSSPASPMEERKRKPIVRPATWSPTRTAPMPALHAQC
jgi:hypothetical protein